MIEECPYCGSEDIKVDGRDWYCRSCETFSIDVSVMLKPIAEKMILRIWETLWRTNKLTAKPELPEYPEPTISPECLETWAGKPMRLKKMTVGDLKNLLDGMRNDYLVVLSGDAEGNGFSILEDHSFAYCEEDRDVFFEQDAEDLNEDYPGDNCLVLWPR